MRDGFIDSIIPYLRGEIKGRVLHVTVKAQALFAEVSSCQAASNNKGEAVGFSFVVCERAMKRIQNPNGFILQNGFTFYRKWVHFLKKMGSNLTIGAFL